VRLFDGPDAGSGPRSLEGLAQTLAHELGHFLSLFHTTEVSGVVFEDIPDTPFSLDGDGDGLIDSGGPDADNVMYPFAGVGNTEWTADQVQAMRDYLSIAGLPVDPAPLRAAPPERARRRSPGRERARARGSGRWSRNRGARPGPGPRPGRGRELRYTRTGR